MSPTVLRESGYQIKIYLNDHPPAHVHVVKGTLQARISLDPVELENNWDFNARELGKILEIIHNNQHLLLTAWDKYHSER